MLGAAVAVLPVADSQARQLVTLVAHDLRSTADAHNTAEVLIAVSPYVSTVRELAAVVDDAALVMDLLRAGGRALAAAAELGIHPNTLRYRLGRIRDIGEIDLDDRDERLALMVELRLSPTDDRGQSAEPRIYGSGVTGPA